MKRFKSEFAHSYATYSFGYCEYAVLERGEGLHEAYDEGFLPFSGSPDIKHTLYMARSARIDLKKFVPNSENRRILRRFDGPAQRGPSSAQRSGKLQRNIFPFARFDIKDPLFRTFCLEYFAKRHGERVMPAERFDTILHAGFITHIVEYTDADGVIVGYVFLCDDDIMSHFWFSFYDLAYAYQSLGLWLMLDCARMAQENKKRFFYVGTVYGEKALYKTNIDSLEFWDGEMWKDDVRLLRTLGKSDDRRIHDGISLWKEGLPRFDE